MKKKKPKHNEMLQRIEMLRYTVSNMLLAYSIDDDRRFKQEAADVVSDLGLLRILAGGDNAD